MDQLQGSLCSSLQGEQKNLKEPEYQRLCSNLTCCTSQCGTFHQNAAGPHPGDGKSHNGYTSRHNIGRVSHEDYIRAIDPSCSPQHKTCDITSQELPAEKSVHCSTPAKLGHRASRNSTPSDPNSSQDRNVYSKSWQKFDPKGYCSSHGYKVE